MTLNKNLCTECNVNYYPKENDSLNIGEYINCYREPEGYYLNIDLYKNVIIHVKHAIEEEII